MTADGLASAVSVLGPKAGIELIDGVENAAAFVVRAPKDQIETYRSRRWASYPEVKPNPAGR
jgi:thiamine biosynthesis lipoprotein ApbE